MKLRRINQSVYAVFENTKEDRIKWYYFLKKKYNGPNKQLR